MSLKTSNLSIFCVKLGAEIFVRVQRWDGFDYAIANQPYNKPYSKKIARKRDL